MENKMEKEKTWQWCCSIPPTKLDCWHHKKSFLVTTAPVCTRKTLKPCNSIPSSFFEDRITLATLLHEVLDTDITTLVAVLLKHFISTTHAHTCNATRRSHHSQALLVAAVSVRQWHHQSGSAPEAFRHNNTPTLAMPLQQDHTIHMRSRLLQEVLDNGITSLAVVLKHSFLFPEHEEQVGALAKSMGFTQISLSSEVMPMVKMVPRGYTAAADAYLTPHIMKYALRQVLS